MDTGHKFGLVMMYTVMSIYTLIMLRILIQLFFGAAIENRRRRQWMQQHGGAARGFRAMAGKRGWANAWLPQNPEVHLPDSSNKATGGWVSLPFLVRQAIALIFILFAVGVAATVAAQAGPARDLAATDLRKQLIDIRAKEIQLRIRLEQIDQQLKPEAIERELAGIGSVHPEDLRENRRRLLTLERNGLQAQLDLLEEYRAGIEAAIVIDEEAAALMKYERRAQAKPSPPQPQMAMVLRNVRPTAVTLQKLFPLLGVSLTVVGGLFLLLLVGIQKSARWIAANRPSTSTGRPLGGTPDASASFAAPPLERG